MKCYKRIALFSFDATESSLGTLVLKNYKIWRVILMFIFERNSGLVDSTNILMFANNASLTFKALVPKLRDIEFDGMRAIRCTIGKSIE